jgi:hypothetical protein
VNDLGHAAYLKGYNNRLKSVFEADENIDCQCTDTPQGMTSLLLHMNSLLLVSKARANQNSPSFLNDKKLYFVL